MKILIIIFCCIIWGALMGIIPKFWTMIIASILGGMAISMCVLLLVN